MTARSFGAYRPCKTIDDDVVPGEARVRCRRFGAYRRLLRLRFLRLLRFFRHREASLRTRVEAPAHCAQWPALRNALLQNHFAFLRGPVGPVGPTGPVPVMKYFRL